MARADYINLYGVQAYWRPYVGGVFEEEEEFGLIDEISVTFAEDSIKHTSRQCGSVGISDRTASSSIEITGSILTPEISPTMIARAFKGTLVNNNIAAGTATENSVTITALDTNCLIGLSHLTPGTLSVWDTTGQTGVEYTEGTDYSINYTHGIIVALTGGAITASDEVFVTADNLAYNHWTVAGFTGSAAVGKLRVIACAVEEGSDVEYTFEKVQLAMDGDYQMVSAEDFLTIPLKMDVLTDETVTAGKSTTINIRGYDSITPVTA